MKKWINTGYILIPTILFAMITSSCNEKKTAQSSGIMLENLDTTTSPKTDFYQYACGGWMQNNPLTGEYSRFGSFDKLAEDNRQRLNDLFVEIVSKQAKEGTNEQKIGDLYKLALDSVKLNSDGYQPIKPALDKIGAVKTSGELSKLIPELALKGVSSFFQIYVDADPMSSREYLVQTYQGGIAMGQRDYYLEEDKSIVDIRNKYKEHVTKMFQLTGFTSEAAQKNMEAVLKIETRLAKAAYTNEELRNPRGNYNKMSIEELQKLIPEINWNEFFTSYGVKDLKEINISQKESIVEVGKIIASEPIADQIAYLQWCLIDQSASYLSDDIFAQNFDFFGRTMSGKEEPQARWKRAVSSVNGALGEVVGQIYVKKYFPKEAKARMLELVKNLQTALGERINTLDWMGDSTKLKAQEKLNTFHVKIGYPDKWRDYSGLNIEKDSYYANIQRSNKFETEYMFSKLGKPVDIDEWHMTPQTVNAYYNPTTNEICFPAGILQYPFFDMNADDAFNYGAIGVVIGHEMTHGFDDQGRQFDKDGNLKDWWTAEDAKRFDQRAQVMVNFFDSIEVAPGVHANGRFTLGENIADYGGLKVAFLAFQNATKNKSLPVIDGLTPEQRFYLAYSGVWASNIRPEEILVRTKTDPHSLGKWRVNGQLPHQDPWYLAFDVKEGDPMFVPVAKRVSIW